MPPKQFFGRGRSDGVVAWPTGVQAVKNHCAARPTRPSLESAKVGVYLGGAAPGFDTLSFLEFPGLPSWVWFASQQLLPFFWSTNKAVVVHVLLQCHVWGNMVVGKFWTTHGCFEAVGSGRFARPSDSFFLIVWGCRPASDYFRMKFYFAILYPSWAKRVQFSCFLWLSCQKDEKKRPRQRFCAILVLGCFRHSDCETCPVARLGQPSCECSSRCAGAGSCQVCSVACGWCPMPATSPARSVICLFLLPEPKKWGPHLMFSDLMLGNYVFTRHWRKGIECLCCVVQGMVVQSLAAHMEGKQANVVYGSGKYYSF